MIGWRKEAASEVSGILFWEDGYLKRKEEYGMRNSIMNKVIILFN